MRREFKRATIYLYSELHHALRLKSVETNRSLSDMVNEAVQLSLAEDAEDLEALSNRARESDLLFEDLVKDLRRRGKI